jgi:thiol-disulfide isomerase/thioredoxin
VLRIRLPDGTPAKGRRVKVEYYDGHYGMLVVFSGTAPDSGELTLRGLTDRATYARADHAYSVTVDKERLGSFGFTNDKAVPQLDFHLPPRTGDLAPDVELRNIATGKSMRLSSLRGKVVCLEFWATWCGPCQPAMAKLNELIGQQGVGWKDRVAIVPASIDVTGDGVKSHVAQRGWDRLEHYWVGEGSGFYSAPARAFVVSGVPEAILIGPDGRIRWRGHPMDKSGGIDLKARIETELKK